MWGFAARLVAVALVSGTAGYFVAQAQPAATRIELSARKFEFGQREVRVKKGQPVTLVLSGTDFVHGFSMPDFKVRTDVIPGKLTEITVTPDKAGKFHFLCDNFCGEGHDQMSGFLIVTD